MVRSLVRSRGLTVAVVLTLSLGIGALTATVALGDAALLRPPPFTEARRLAILYVTRTRTGQGARRERWSWARIQLLRQLATPFDDVANYSGVSLTLTGADDAEPISGEAVAPAYFPTLGVRAALGRLFTEDEDDAPGAHPIALISDALWRRRFGGDSGVVGRAIGVNRHVLTVVGVLPPGFAGLTGNAQLWVPTSMAPVLTYPEYLTTNQNFISVVSRLREGTDLGRAQAELAVLGARIQQSRPSTVYDPAETISATAVSLNDARIAPDLQRSVLVLLSAVALLHLLACANVTSLLLGRAAARRREVAIRVALGCGQARLLRQLLAEGLVLVAIAGTLGTFLAWQACSLVTVPAALLGPRNFYGSLASFSQPVGGWRLVLAGTAATVLTALLVAWAPAVSAVRVSVAGGLRESARGMARGAASLRRFSARGAVVATEAALAVILLVGGGLMIETWSRIRGTKLGIEPDHVLTFWVRPPEAQVPKEAAPAFVSHVLEAITRVPGVVSATVDGGAPVNGTARSVLYIVGRPAPPPRDAPPVLRHYVGPDHFRTLGVPVLRGRVFNAGDVEGQPRVAVISETAARRFWADRDPIGQRVWFGGGSNFDRPDSSATIVGIVGDVVYEPIDQQPNRSSFYTPYEQFTYGQRAYFVRTTGDPLSVLSGIQRAVRTVDPALPLFDVQTLNELIGSSWARHTFDAMLFGGFAAAALLLAASGIFAVVAYSVAERTREMGIRLALGATPEAVVRLVLREGLSLPLIGLAVGVAASLALTRLLRASLYEVTATDPVVFAAAVGLLVAAAVLACLIPARRATLVDPLEALRAD